MRALNRHTDAATRVSDEFNTHRMADPYGSIGKYFAAALNDGRSDHVLYDSKQDCIRHQHHNEQFYTFIRISPTTMNPCNAEVMLSVARRAYDNGMRLTDPDHKSGGPELIKRTSLEDQLALSHGFVTNVRMPGEEW